jgi:hypothetical protein
VNEVSQEQIIRRYLLGQTVPEESALVEEQLLAGDSFYQELLIVEDELLDEYLSAQLSRPERESFENHFLLAPERQQKLRFARVLRRFVNLSGTEESRKETAGESLSSAKGSVAKSPPAKFFSVLPFRSPLVSYAVLAAMLLLIGGVSWRLFNGWQQQATHPAGAVLAVMLTPGVTRGGGDIKRVMPAPNTGTIRLQLQIGTASYPSYRVVVISSDHSEVWTRTNLPAQDLTDLPVVSADVPATLLNPDDYQIRLSGQLSNGAFEDVATYQLRVTR